jgi:hypothetical protein
MVPRARWPALLLLATVLSGGAARAQGLAYPDPGQQCRSAIVAAERAFGIPPRLMAAIGRVESGRRGADGRVDPWPWSIDAEGAGQTFDSKAAAMAAVRALLARGVRSVDVGCLQVNLLHHPDAFATLDAAFDPAANATYAARFLVQLRAASGSWPAAAALYHSATPELAAAYERKVMAAWTVERADGGDDAAAPAPPLLRPAAGGTAPGGAQPVQRFWRPGLGPAKVIPLAAGQTGRSLAAYRALPVPLAAPLAAPAPRGPG